MFARMAAQSASSAVGSASQLRPVQHTAWSSTEARSSPSDGAFSAASVDYDRRGEAYVAEDEALLDADGAPPS